MTEMTRSAAPCRGLQESGGADTGDSELIEIRSGYGIFLWVTRPLWVPGTGGELDPRLRDVQI
jgi:hypothetical protein